ncbi:threonine--tRNA ligase [Candidatus Woesearchaeota archaeon]|nr:threonine--tRNA ligase [Candidatus Woesearchaeota archaeon]
MLSVTINGTKKQISEGTKIKDLVDKKAIAAEMDAVEVDLSRSLTKEDDGAKIEPIFFDSMKGKEIFWHSASHLMTQAILRIFKNQNIGLGVGMPVGDGFYQDYDMETIHPEDLEKIEQEMRKIVNEGLEITQKDVPKKEALEFYKNDPYKIELTNAVEGNEVSMYSQGEFKNLCKGPHVPNTSHIKAFKLTRIAGAYWRGDSKNKMLTRIYGIAFPEEKQLKEYLNFIEEAKKRDHRKLGQELELFSLDDEAGPGFPFFHPKGMIIWNILQDFWRKEHTKEEYHEVRTPIILKKDLWLQSGHWDHYRDNMYFTKIDNADFAVKPMNCPGGILIYKKRPHSYRELPLRIGEMGLVHRHELSGVLAGLFRVRCFTQDDAHIYCTEEQAKDEIKRIIALIDRFYKVFGFNYKVELSTQPSEGMGSAKLKKKSEDALREALEELKIPYVVKEGEGAFYGPKIDFHIEDCLKRTWQCGTIQFDFNMPERFDLRYMAEDGTDKHRPVMLHRVIYGSMERFLGILIEHYAGKFPLWLAPVQIKVMTVSDKSLDYGNQVVRKLMDQEFRVELDTRAESIPRKVREAQLQKIPLMVTVGEKEAEKNVLAVRTLDGKVHFDVTIDDFIAKVKKLVDEKSQKTEM